MNAQVSWKKIRTELQRLADVDKLKTEVTRIGNEIKNFDFHSVLSPSAAAKVKNFEKRYSELMRTLHQAQRQVDREFNKVLRQIKVHRSDVNKVVAQQKTKLEKASQVLKKRFSKKAVSRPAPVRKAKAARSTKKRRKA